MKLSLLSGSAFPSHAHHIPGRNPGNVSVENWIVFLVGKKWDANTFSNLEDVTVLECSLSAWNSVSQPAMPAIAQLCQRAVLACKGPVSPWVCLLEEWPLRTLPFFLCLLPPSPEMRMSLQQKTMCLQQKQCVFNRKLRAWALSLLLFLIFCPPDQSHQLVKAQL